MKQDTINELESARRELTALLEREQTLSDQADALRQQLATARAELDSTTDEQAALRLLAKVTATTNQLAQCERQLAEVAAQKESAERRYNVSYWRRLESDVQQAERAFADELWETRSQLQRLIELDSERAEAQNRSHGTEHAAATPAHRQLLNVLESWLVHRGYAKRRVESDALSAPVEFVRIAA